MALSSTLLHRTNVQAGKAITYTRLDVGQGHYATFPDGLTGGSATPPQTPFSPAKSHTNPPGDLSGPTRTVDWVDGYTGDAVGYDVKEICLYAAAAGESEYLAFYESVATGFIFSKGVGNIFTRRLRLEISDADSVNTTFPVSSVPAASRRVHGVQLLAGAREFRNTASAITASLTAPVIIQVGDVNASDELVRAATGHLPLLVIDDVAASAKGFGLHSGVLRGLRLHAAGAAAALQYADGDNVYLNAAGTGFAKSGARQVGYVLDGDTATGLYEVVMDLWATQLAEGPYAVSALPGSAALNQAILYHGPTRVQTGWAAAIAKPSGTNNVIAGIGYKPNSDLVGVFEPTAGVSAQALYTHDGANWDSGLTVAGSGNCQDVAVNPTNGHISVLRGGYTVYTHDGTNWDSGITAPSSGADGIAYDSDGNLYLLLGSRLYRRVGANWNQVWYEDVNETEYDLAFDLAGRANYVIHQNSLIGRISKDFGYIGRSAIFTGVTSARSIAFRPSDGALAIGNSNVGVYVATYDNVNLPDDTGWLRWTGTVWVKAA